MLLISTRESYIGSELSVTTHQLFVSDIFPRLPHNLCIIEGKYISTLTHNKFIRALPDH